MEIHENVDRHKYMFNDYPSVLKYKGLKFLNAESAFQSQKCPEYASDFCNLTAKEAIMLGQKVNISKDWNKVKDNIMLEVMRCKFYQSKRLANRLTNTYPLPLEINDNMKLASLLMKIRKELFIRPVGF